MKQFRNDSVDEIDTSDMEAYLTGKPNKRYPLSKAQVEEVISSQIIKGQLDTECTEDPKMQGIFDFQVQKDPNQPLINEHSNFYADAGDRDFDQMDHDGETNLYEVEFNSPYNPFRDRTIEDAEQKEQWERQMVRNRIDSVRLLLGKDSGYTLRTFKKIVKRDRAEHPQYVDEVIKKLGTAPVDNEIESDYEDMKKEWEGAAELNMGDYKDIE